MVWMRPRVRPGPAGRHVRCSHEEAPKTRHPVVPHGFGAPPAIRREAQVPRTVLIERVRRPAWRIQADELRGAPVRPVRHQHDLRARQGLLLTAHHKPDLARSGRRTASVKHPYVCSPTVTGRDAVAGSSGTSSATARWGPGELQRPAVGISPQQAGRLQQAVRCEQADPVRAPPSHDLDPVLCHVPGVEHHHPTGHLGPDGLCSPLERQRDVGPALVDAAPDTREPGATPGPPADAGDAAPCGPSGSGRQERAWPPPLPPGSAPHRGESVAGPGKAPWAADREAGHRVVGQRRGPSAVVVVPVHLVQETAHRLAQRLINDDDRLAAATAMGFRLVPPDADPTVIAGVFPPGSLRDHAGEMGVCWRGRGCRGPYWPGSCWAAR